MKATVYALGFGDWRTVSSLYSVRVHSQTPWVRLGVDAAGAGG
jgi:hypothetical protein